MGTVIGHGLPLSADPERQRPSSGTKRSNTMRERERERERERTDRHIDTKTERQTHSNKQTCKQKAEGGCEGVLGVGGRKK